MKQTERREILTRERARELIEAMSERRLVVVGDIMLDRYIWGDVSRISPEAPVPIVESRRQSHRLGAAVNVAANLRALGANAELVAVVGDDVDGRTLMTLVEEAGIGTSGIVICPSRPTTVKTRVIARNQQIVRVDAETTSDVAGHEGERLAERLAEMLEHADGVVVSDYGKGVVTAALLGHLMGTVRASGTPVAVDPKEDHFASYRGVDVITPNLGEAGGAVGRRLRTDADVDAAGQELVERLSATSVLITRGEHGMSLYGRGEPVHLAARAREVYDVTGAGDTVVSVFALARTAGATHAEAADLSNRAAGLVVREVGTAVASPDVLLESVTADGEAR
jgi:D-beta-D-heptose 7-phosphate kinase/D-beta-D-heptose 1-phosphate adenosyltransferase